MLHYVDKMHKLLFYKHTDKKLTNKQLDITHAEIRVWHSAGEIIPCYFFTSRITVKEVYWHPLLINFKNKLYSLKQHIGVKEKSAVVTPASTECSGLWVIRHLNVARIVSIFNTQSLQDFARGSL